jgi:hypothetical protein
MTVTDETSDERALAALLQRIDDLGGNAAYPVVPLDAFFDGNADTASIAPNVEPHPGVATIRSRLEAVRARPDVADVVMRISEVLEPPEWPFADMAYVLTTTDPESIEQTVGDLGCEVYPLEPDEWQDGAPAGTPAIPAGHRVVVVWWD